MIDIKRFLNACYLWQKDKQRVSEELQSSIAFKKDTPKNIGACHVSEIGGLDAYGTVLIGKSTISKIITNPDIIKKVIFILEQLDTDEYVNFTLNYYREGLKKFGDNWFYADIVTALYGISSLIKPTSYLEIGVRRGRSMAMVASVCPECHIVGFDIWKTNYAGMPNPGPDFVRDELVKLGYKGKLELIDGNSHITVKEYFQKNPDIYFDLITVDGDHTAQGALEDLSDVLPHLKIGGVVVFDDIIHPQHKYLYQVWNHTIKDKDRFASWEFDEMGYGVAVAVRRI